MIPRMIADGFSMDTCCGSADFTIVPDRETRMKRNHSSANSGSSCLPGPPTANSLFYVIPRFIWMGLGPCVMMALAVVRIESTSLNATATDLIFGLTVAAILTVRWLSWYLGDRRDSFGCRIGPAGLVIYSSMQIFFSCLLWGLVYLIVSQNAF